MLQFSQSRPRIRQRQRDITTATSRHYCQRCCCCNVACRCRNLAISSREPLQGFAWTSFAVLFFFAICNMDTTSDVIRCMRNTPSIGKSQRSKYARLLRKVPSMSTRLHIVKIDVVELNLCFTAYRHIKGRFYIFWFHIYSRASQPGDRQTDRQTASQPASQTDRQTYKQTDRQTDRSTRWLHLLFIDFLWFSYMPILRSNPTDETFFYLFICKLSSEKGCSIFHLFSK